MAADCVTYVFGSYNLTYITQWYDCCVVLVVEVVADAIVVVTAAADAAVVALNIIAIVIVATAAVVVAVGAVATAVTRRYIHSLNQIKYFVPKECPRILKNI